MNKTPRACPKCGYAHCRMIDIGLGLAMRDVTVCWETDCQQRQLDNQKAEIDRLRAQVDLLVSKVWGA